MNDIDFYLNIIPRILMDHEIFFEGRKQIVSGEYSPGIILNISNDLSYLVNILSEPNQYYQEEVNKFIPHNEKGIRQLNITNILDYLNKVKISLDECIKFIEDFQCEKKSTEKF